MQIHLKPFYPSSQGQISCDLEVSMQQLTLSFAFSGLKCDLNSHHGLKGPKEKLYEHTCFELFLGNFPNYCEWNFAPDGHWDNYVFSDYRQLTEHTLDDLQAKHFDLATNVNSGVLKLLIPMNPLKKYLNLTKPLFIKPTVVEAHGSERNYWAPDHANEQPDFHEQNTFLRCNIL